MDKEVLRLSGNQHQKVSWTHLVNPPESELAQELSSRRISLPVPYESYRATFDRYAAFYYVRFYGFKIGDHSQMLEVVPVHLAVQSSGVISWSTISLKALDRVTEKITAHSDSEYDSNTLTYYLLDELVEDTFTVLDVFNDRLAGVEHDVFSASAGQAHIQQEIFRLKREILKLRHILASERDVSYQLVRYWDSDLNQSSRTEWSFQLYDHVIRLFDSADIYRELVNSALDIYLGSVSNRLNEIVKKLTLVTVLFVPASLVAALYGMNFDYLPGQHHPWGFFLIVGVVVVMSLTLLAIFRQRRWL
ncbi:MAG: magnesium transporter CorA family protein [Firmicutes bacterium]|nr:magnesium transporter CorA family protein [Bacillota bacterium]